MAETAVVVDAEGGAASRLVDAVCLHLAGGPEVPAFVWMLSGGDDEKEGSGREVGAEGSFGLYNSDDGTGTTFYF